MAAQSPPEVLPRGRHAAPPTVVAASQRTRLLTAMAEAVARDGYAETSVADVLQAARVSRRSFYEHFSNKEDCFLRACEHGVGELLTRITEQIQTEASPDAAIAAGLTAYLRSLDADPAFARIFLIEVLGAGPVALQRRSEVLETIAALVRSIHLGATPAPPELPPHRYLAATAALNELVADHVRRHGTADLARLHPTLVDILHAMLDHPVDRRAAG